MRILQKIIIYTILGFILNSCGSNEEIKTLKEAKDRTLEDHEKKCQCYEEVIAKGQDLEKEFNACDEKYYWSWDFPNDISESDKKEYIRYSDELFEKREEITKKFKKTEPLREAVCNICGRTFTGRGWELEYNGECKEVGNDHLGFLCSCECAKKARNNLNEAVNDAKEWGKNNH